MTTTEIEAAAYELTSELVGEIFEARAVLQGDELERTRQAYADATAAIVQLVERAQRGMLEGLARHCEKCEGYGKYRTYIYGDSGKDVPCDRPVHGLLAALNPRTHQQNSDSLIDSLGHVDLVNMSPTKEVDCLTCTGSGQVITNMGRTHHCVVCTGRGKVSSDHWSLDKPVRKVDCPPCGGRGFERTLDEQIGALYHYGDLSVSGAEIRALIASQRREAVTKFAEALKEKEYRYAEGGSYMTDASVLVTVIDAHLEAMKGKQ